jgi:hypothetical protein
MFYCVLNARHKICNVSSHLKLAPDAARDFNLFDAIVASAYVFEAELCKLQGCLCKSY